MKKLQIKFSFQESQAIDECLATMVKVISHSSNLTYSEKCVMATIEQWRISKLHPKTHYRTESGKVSIKLDAPVSMALACVMSSVIADVPELVHHQSINKLTQIFNQIDQHFK